MPEPSLTTSEAELRAHVERALTTQYALESEIGRGGMGIVYRARDRRLKRHVAVKLLPPELAFRSEIRSRFLREAETAAQLSHPNIVPIYTVGEQDNLVFFVMAYVSGDNLAKRLHDKGRMSVEDTRRVLIEVAEALAYAHARGVVHRDIKPDNILLDAETGRAMVTDFGIARAVSEGGGDSRLTATGMAIGTPAYMSPEQCAGEREIDGRSDLYSLGIVGYQMLAGEPPFTGASTSGLLVKQITEAPVQIGRRRPDVPTQLAYVVMKLLAKDPANRFATGAAVVAALDGAVGSGGPRAEAPAPSARESVPDGSARRSQHDRHPVPRPREEDGAEEDELERVEHWLGDENIFGGVIIDTSGGRSRREGRAARRRERWGLGRPLPARIRGFRSNAAGYVATTALLFGINALTSPEFWWAVFPAMGMLVGLAQRAGSLWADGVRPGEMLAGSPEGIAARVEAERTGASLPAATGAAAPPAPLPGPSPSPAEPPDEAEALAPRAVLDGAHGAAIRRAVADRRSVGQLIGRLGEADRAMLPDVLPTADALVQRIASLAIALHHLDADAAPERLRALDERIAALEPAAPGSPDRERTLALLRRQRGMLEDLVQSRARLADQLESATLLLQNLALDLLRLRSAGVQSVLDDVASATREARALSRDIGAVLDAAAELRAMDQR